MVSGWTSWSSSALLLGNLASLDALAEEDENQPLLSSAPTGQPFLAAEPQALSTMTETPDSVRGISGHEPVYALLSGNWRGKGSYGLKFQFSLKYRLLNPDNAAHSVWWERFYLGYTQSSLMDLTTKSSPFHDSAYRPEVFWEQLPVVIFPRFKTFEGMRLGFGHESNGKASLDSRSINIAYVRPVFSGMLGSHGQVWSFSPKVYGYLEKSDNPDIADYRGYGDFEFQVSRKDSWAWSAMVRQGMKNHGSIRLDASYPFRGLLRNLNGSLYLQYFNGYGETILDYNRKQPSRVGFGLIVVR